MLIEDAIGRCGGVKMQVVKSHLLRALKEISEAEKKEKRRNNDTPDQRWKFDISTGRLMNMTREQMNNALKNIEKMIEEEAGKNNKQANEGKTLID